MLVASPCLQVGTLAVFVRQTNVVWVLFAFGVGVVRTIESTDRRALYTEADQREPLGVKGLWVYWWRLLSWFARQPALVALRLLWPMVCTAVLFGLFVWINGSVVVGDHSNHQASIHLVHPLYFSAAALVACPGCARPKQLARFVRALRGRPLCFLGAFLLAAVLVSKFT